MSDRFDAMAERIFKTAITEKRSGELLMCLFDGGSATVDPNGELVLIDKDGIAQLRAG